MGRDGEGGGGKGGQEVWPSGLGTGGVMQEQKFRCVKLNFALQTQQKTLK